jgi:hypothetical protein
MGCEGQAAHSADIAKKKAFLQALPTTQVHYDFTFSNVSTTEHCMFPMDDFSKTFK